MLGVKIILNQEDEPLPEYAQQIKEKRVIQGQLKAIAALPGGMSSGKPSIGFWCETPDGQVAYFETSMALLQTAAIAFKARYGEPT